MKNNNFFRINILIDIFAFLLTLFLLILLTYRLAVKHEDAGWIAYLVLSPVFFFLRFIFMFFQIFRYKKIKIWKTILYCIVLLLVTYILFLTTSLPGIVHFSLIWKILIP